MDGSIIRVKSEITNTIKPGSLGKIIEKTPFGTLSVEFDETCWVNGKDEAENLDYNYPMRYSEIELVEQNHSNPKTKIEHKSIRKNNGKPKLGYLDPEFLKGMADILTLGEDKYEKYNFLKPTDWSTPYDSAMRHLLAFWGGEDDDRESGKHHLLHAATNLMFLYYQINNYEDGDDREY